MSARTNQLNTHLFYITQLDYIAYHRSNQKHFACVFFFHKKKLFLSLVLRCTKHIHLFNDIMIVSSSSIQFNRWKLKEKLFIYFVHWTLTWFDCVDYYQAADGCEHNIFHFFCLSPLYICFDSALISISILSFSIFFLIWMYSESELFLLLELMFFLHNLIFCLPTMCPKAIKASQISWFD